MPSMAPLIVTLLLLTLSTVTGATTNPNSIRTLDDQPTLHFTLNRRGGVFDSKIEHSDLVNFPYLLQELDRVEQRYSLTKRTVKGNKLVRKAKEDGPGGNEHGRLMGEVGGMGKWYANMSIGSPPQQINVDLDMLTSDFYVVTTTSKRGTRYDDIFSKSYVKSDRYTFPRCTLPTESFLLPTVRVVADFIFAYCRPSKSSSHTLGVSGGVLGLAPSEHLRQTHGPPLLSQMLDKKVIKQPIFSLMLINGEQGVLSVGGTAANAVEFVSHNTKAALDRLATPGETQGPKVDLPPFDLEKRMEKAAAARLTVSSDNLWREKFKWAHVQGADGFWQILMQGVWIGGSKILKDQPVVLDINSPFILAPPLAVLTLYDSIPGARSLAAPHSGFYIFPCLNAPKLSFEFDAWSFPVMRKGKMLRWDGPPGGLFSLGRLENGSGYCVGAVVESRMGEHDDRVLNNVMSRVTGRSERSQATLHRGSGEIAGNGMKGVWVLGEPWFRGVGAVFDFKEQMVGFRSY